MPTSPISTLQHHYASPINVVTANQASLDCSANDPEIESENSCLGARSCGSERAYTGALLLHTSLVHTTECSENDFVTVPPGDLSSAHPKNMPHSEGINLVSANAQMVETSNATSVNGPLPQFPAIVPLSADFPAVLKSQTPNNVYESAQQKDTTVLVLSSAPEESLRRVSNPNNVEPNSAHDEEMLLNSSPSSHSHSQPFMSSSLPPSSSPLGLFSSALPSSQSSIGDQVEKRPSLIAMVDRLHSPRSCSKEDDGSPVESFPSMPGLPLVSNLPSVIPAAECFPQSDMHSRDLLDFTDGLYPKNVILESGGEAIPCSSAERTDSGVSEPAKRQRLAPNVSSQLPDRGVAPYLQDLQPSEVQPFFKPSILLSPLKQQRLSILSDTIKDSPNTNDLPPLTPTEENKPGPVPGSADIPNALSDCKKAELMHVEVPIFDLDPGLLLGKRKTQSDNYDGVELRVQALRKAHRPTSDEKGNTEKAPYPRRATLAAQRLQHKKLTSPFRPPAALNSQPDRASMTDQRQQLVSSSPARDAEQTVSEQIAVCTYLQDAKDARKKHRTERAAAPFKSPLKVDALKPNKHIRMTPGIQTLERQLQLLKRAVKVKQDREEETLEKLIKKWTEAGREIAYEVWDVVKERISNDDQRLNKALSKGQFETSGDGNKQDLYYDKDERNWGWDIEPSEKVDEKTDEVDFAQQKHRDNDEDNDDDQKRRDTLGTMLRQLGIAPEVLGWDEEEETFRDG